MRSGDIRNGTIGSPDVRNGALRAEDFRAGQLPAGERGPQGDQGRPGQDATKLFAYIRDSGNGDTATVESGNGVTAVEDDPLPTAGHYAVTFNRSLVNCVVVATQGIGSPAGTGGASTIGPAHPDVQVAFPTDNQASVTVYNGSSVTEDSAFMIAALC